jgi:integrase
MNGRIRKRGEKSWELTIDLGRDEYGKRLRKFLNVKGPKAEAQKKLRDLLTSLEKGLSLDTSKATVGVFLEIWLRDYVATNTAPSTADGYGFIVRCHLIPKLGNIPLAKLLPAHLQSYYAEALVNGRSDAKGGLSAKTVKHHHRVLSEALSHAVKWGLIARNVAQAVDPPKPRRHEIQPPSIDGVLEILALARETKYRPVLEFMAGTGVRRAEALGLRWTDLDLDRGTAAIVQTLQRIQGKGLVFQQTKTRASRRSIKLDPDTVAMLREHRGSHLLRKLDLAEVYQDTGLVFPGPLGRPLDPSVLTHSFKKLARKAGLEGVRLHDLRHSHATVMLESGVNPKVVQERLGHSSISMTMDTYSHVMDGLQERAALAYAEAMETARQRRQR